MTNQTVEVARKPERSQVFNTLQAGRAIAAIMVAIYHTNGIFAQDKYWNHGWTNYLICGGSGVQFFFVLSGIVILHAHWNELGKPSVIGSYAWKRFRRVYPIYWVVLIGTFAIYVAIPSFGHGYERDPLTAIQSFFLVYVTTAMTVVPTAWSLFHEIMFYVIFGFAILNRRIGLWVVGAWMALSAVAVFVQPAGAVARMYVSPLHLLFGFGMLVTIFIRRRIAVGWWLAIVGTLAFAACCVQEDIAQGQTPWLTIAYGVAAALATSGFMALEQQGKVRVSKSLVFLGGASYSIYLVHYMMLAAEAKVVYPLWKHHPVPLIIPFLVLLVGAVAFGCAVHVWIERPLIQLMSKSKKSRSAVAA